MRGINVSNSNKRNAEVAFESITEQNNINYVLQDGSERENIKILKSTIDLSEDVLVNKYGDLKALGAAIISSDPEIDIELLGKKIDRTHKLYLSKDNKIAYRVNMVQVVYNVDGSEKERKDLTKELSTIKGESMLHWSGRKIPKVEAVRKFVFTRKYQIKHVNGLTFDFLYNMAKELHDTQSLMRVGAGEKGNKPIVLSTGGTPYRGFLEGRVDADKYCLILHLTNMEFKGLSETHIAL